MGVRECTTSFKDDPLTQTYKDNKINSNLRFGGVLDLQIIDLKNPEYVAEFLLQFWRNVDVGFILNIFVDQVHHPRVEIDEVEFVGELEDSPKERRYF